MATRIQLRRDTAANWTAVNPILGHGELGIETDTLKIKVGNSVGTWSERPYITVTPSELAELAQDSIDSALVAGVGLDKVYEDSSNTLTINIDSTVVTQSGEQTLTNKTITSPKVSGLYLSDNSVTFEGQGGDDQYETILSVENPTADRTLILPDASDHLVARDTEDTLTNKTLTEPKINGSTVLTATSGDLNLLDGATFSSEEINYLTGVTSSIQDQLDGKQPVVSGVSDTEISYLDGVTSSIQDQIDSKLDLAGGTLTGPVAMSNNNITGLATPSEVDHAAQKGYVDSSAEAAINSANSSTDDKIGDATVDGTLENTITDRIQTALEAANEYTNSSVGGLENTVEADYVPIALLEQPEGVATLDIDGYVPLVQLNPSVSILDEDGLLPLEDLNSKVVITDSAQTLTNKRINLPKINEDVEITATSTEINYLDGLESSAQNQIDSKLALSGGTLTGSLTLNSDPSSALHAATKQYVDNTASGIVAKPQVLGATTLNIDATYNNGTAGVGATLTHNTNGVFPATAGGAEGWAVGKGILVKNQTNKAQNGRYYVSDMGSPSTPYVLTRCGYCDEASEIPGAYIFVQDGTNAGTGWVQTVADATTFTVGTDDINVIQFSGSGSYTAGNGLVLNGTSYSIDSTITADLSTSQTLTNKTISGLANTISNIGNSSLSNSSVTLGTTEISLGETASTIEGLTSITATSFIGEASTVENGVYTNGSYTDPSWLTITKDKVGLGSVENIAITTYLDTWAGSASIDSLGTITDGTWNGTEIAIAYGGTGATTATDAINNLLPDQSTNTDKFLTTDGSSASWADVPAGYDAPTIGTTLIESGETVTTIDGLTLSDPILTGSIEIPEPVDNSNPATKLYVDTAAATVSANNSALEIIPLDDVSSSFNGAETRFIPKVSGVKLTITNPLRLLISINGIIQMLGNQDNHWLSPIAADGFYIDGDGYIQFNEPVPEGSTFDARLMPGKTVNTLEKSRYPFRATDILLGA